MQRHKPTAALLRSRKVSRGSCVAASHAHRLLLRAIAVMLGTLLAVTALPAWAAELAAGKTRAQACVMCHGAEGISQMPNAPSLAGQPAIYLAEQLKNFRSGRRPDEVMGVIAKPLTDAEIDDLAAWYASIAIMVKPK